MASLPQSLAEWRDREGVALDQLARALRVEETMLERIEAGEVAPGNALRERIGKTIEKGFDHKDVAAPIVPSSGHCGSIDAADASPCGAAASSSFSAWLTRVDEAEWQIEGLWDGDLTEVWTIADARELSRQLTKLVAVFDAGPANFAAVAP